MELPAIAYVATISYSIPAIIGIARFRHLSDAMKVLLLLCIFSCLEIVGEFALGHNHLNNAFLSNDFVPIETAFICAAYLLSVEQKMIKRIIFALALVYSAIWIANKIYFDVPTQLNEEMSVTSEIFIIIASVLTIHATMSKTNHYLAEEPIFWVSSGNLIYATGVLLVFGFSNELLKMGTVYFEAAWYINWSLAIIANAMYTKGFFSRVVQVR